MERYASFLLPVWQEVCRHIELDDSLVRLGPLLARRLPLEALVVRYLDRSRSLLETVRAIPAGESYQVSRTREPCSAGQLNQIETWCRGRAIEHDAHQQLSRRLKGIVPRGVRGDVIAGPLVSGADPAGILLLVAKRVPGFMAEHLKLARALLEPFAVALENDHRLRELVALREALEADNRSLLTRLERHDISESIVGAEAGLKPVMEQIELVARADTPVLLLGETGSGKEVVARAIHTRSARASAPFLRVNCGAIPSDLVDSELFGHERGSFTGAVGEHRGWFERADGGTLFLDECGELPLAAQVRLLRILQDGLLQRVGGERAQHVDVRIIAATHRDLNEMVSRGQFRQDLMYRLAVFPIRLPALRDRPADIPALAAHFALRAAKRLGLPALIPDAQDIGLLVAYDWPGNVRELAAVIERAAILGEGKKLDVSRALGIGMRVVKHNLDSAEAAEAGGMPGLEGAGIGRLDRLEVAIKRHIERALIQTSGRIEGRQGAAARLGINPHTLRSKMRRLKIDWSQFRRSEG